jgi:hypothetical protein
LLATSLLVTFAVAHGGDAVYLGEDRTTLGKWWGVYGDCAYILAAVHVETWEDEYQIINGYSPWDETGGPLLPALQYEVYSGLETDVRGLEDAAELTRRSATVFHQTTAQVFLSQIPPGD